MFKHRSTATLVALAIGLSSASVLANGIGSENVTFDEALNGVPFFNFDSNDPDNLTDVVFSTTDPFGFNTAGPGQMQLYIDEPGLEGTTGLMPDLRVDFLQGAVGAIAFGFATIDTGDVTFTAYNAAGVNIGQQVVAGDFFSLGSKGFPGEMSSFPENRVVVPLSGTATYGTFDFRLDSDGFGALELLSEGEESDETDESIEFSGRYIIDNLEYTPAGEDILGGFNGALPEQPILPGEIVQGPNNVPEFIFDVNFDPRGGGGIFPIFIDPVIAVGYDYFVNAGPAVASVLIPSALPNGDTEFTLNLPGFGAFSLVAGVTFDLTSISAAGFNVFSITDIDTSEMLDFTDPAVFVTGLTFLGATQAVVDVSMIPITLNVPGAPGAPVPQPPTLLLLGLGIIVSRWCRQGQQYGR